MTIWRRVEVNGVPSIVRAGDMVYFWRGCNFTDQPQIAVIDLLGEDNMCDLTILSAHFGRVITEKAVCMAGDSKLSSPVHKNKGCWSPRPPVDMLLQSGAMEG